MISPYETENGPFDSSPLCDPLNEDFKKGSNSANTNQLPTHTERTLTMVITSVDISHHTKTSNAHVGVSVCIGQVEERRKKEFDFNVEDSLTVFIDGWSIG